MAARSHSWNHFLFSSDQSLLDLDVIYGFLSTCYWSPDLNRQRFERSLAHSMNFGVYEAPTRKQVGFARVITDRATFAYLADVFVVEAFRGKGLSKQLMEFILADPDLQGLRRFCLLTRDAQGLYRQFGFANLDDPVRYMEKIDRASYKLP